MSEDKKEKEKNNSKSKKGVILAVVISIIVIITIIAVVIGIVIVNTIKAKNKGHAVGETITTRSFEFTLTNAEFCDNYVSIIDAKFLTAGNEEAKYYKDNSTYYNNTKAPNSKEYIVFQFTLKYLGKQKWDYYYIGSNIELDYNNGYKFEPESVYTFSPTNTKSMWTYTYGRSVNKTSTTLEPLEDGGYMARGIFEVPEEVKNNTSAPLKLKFYDEAYNLRQ